MSCNYTVWLWLALSHERYELPVNGLKITFAFSLFLQQLKLQPEIYPEGAKPIREGDRLYYSKQKENV